MYTDMLWVVMSQYSNLNPILGEVEGAGVGTPPEASR